jgi:hypothetical protein
MTWNSHHRRGEILRTVIAVADQRRDGILPMDVDGVAQTFEDDVALLAALELRWHTRLAGQIERNLMTEPMDLESSVIQAWQQTAQAMPGVRAILDHYSAHPETPEMEQNLAVSTAKEHQLLAMMAGKASQIDATCARVGAEIAQRARIAQENSPTCTEDARVLSFVARIKAAMVA